MLNFNIYILKSAFWKSFKKNNKAPITFKLLCINIFTFAIYLEKKLNKNKIMRF